jgi:NADPH:quinone reductase-like Zn-dependent oxidoreductase
VLARGGSLVSTVGQPDAQRASAQGVRALFFMTHPDAGQLSEISALIEAGKVRPRVQSAFPLAEVRMAQGRVEHEHTQGKVVLKMAG